MATATQGRNPNGRPRTTERSPAFYLVDELASKRGLTIAELASESGLTRSTIYTLNDPWLSTIKKISTTLGMKTGKLAEMLAAVEDGEDAPKPTRPNPKCR
jgi:transcriptional regulator with XRE-family HTH domain